VFPTGQRQEQKCPSSQREQTGLFIWVTVHMNLFARRSPEYPSQHILSTDSSKAQPGPETDLDILYLMVLEKFTGKKGQEHV